MATTTLVLSIAEPAAAHTPHDVVASMAISPNFGEDQTAYSIVREYIVKTTDGGDTWTDFKQRFVAVTDEQFHRERQNLHQEEQS